jgi:Protein of unknown function (DUF2892)
VEVQVMTTENAIRLLAGVMVLLGVAITLLVSRWGLLLVGFVGLNLAQSSVTGFCPAESILRRLGVKSGGGGCSA